MADNNGGREAQYDTSEASAVVERAVGRPINQWVAMLSSSVSSSQRLGRRPLRTERGVAAGQCGVEMVQCKCGAVPCGCSRVRSGRSPRRAGW